MKIEHSVITTNKNVLDRDDLYICLLPRFRVLYRNLLWAVQKQGDTRLQDCRCGQLNLPLDPEYMQALSLNIRALSTSIYAFDPSHMGASLCLASRWYLNTMSIPDDICKVIYQSCRKECSKPKWCLGRLQRHNFRRKCGSHV
jgi:hypothetical protein